MYWIKIWKEKLVENIWTVTSWKKLYLANNHSWCIFIKHFEKYVLKIKLKKARAFYFTCDVSNFTAAISEMKLTHSRQQFLFIIV